MLATTSIPFTIAVAVLLTFAQAGPHDTSKLRHRRQISVGQKIRAGPVDSRGAMPVRANEAHADAHRAMRRNVEKRDKACRARTTTTSATDMGATETSATSASSDSSSLPTQQAWAKGSSTASSAAWTQSSTTDSSWSASPTDNSGTSASVSGLLTITDQTCGACDSSDKEPNGSEDWLNCGINGGGWTPPMVTMDQLIAVELSGDGVFSPCSDYIALFNQYGNQYGVHPIMLASFAMQESTCNPGATGGNGEAGLMQIASENCGGAPGGNCYDVNFNIQRAAKLFSGLISSNNGNVLAAIGSYNGWQGGMTYSDATAAASRGDCSAQNNLDYIFQFVNGWMQNKSGYDIGKYFNLKNC